MCGEIGDLFTHDPRKIVHQFLAISVNRGVEHCVAGKKMGDRGSGEVRLYWPACHGVEGREIIRR
jgi:hypothetical protein